MAREADKRDQTENRCRRRIAGGQMLLFFVVLSAFAPRVVLVFFPPSLAVLGARFGLIGSVISSITFDIALDDFRATRPALGAALRAHSSVSFGVSGVSHLYQPWHRVFTPVAQRDVALCS